MPPSEHEPVDERDRRAFERQRDALAEAALDDEGDAGWEEAVVSWADRQREADGVEPLAEWWSAKTEPELHRRARALGLLV